MHPTPQSYAPTSIRAPTPALRLSAPFAVNYGSRVYSRNPANLPDGVAIHTGTIDGLEERLVGALQVESIRKSKQGGLNIDDTVNRGRMEGGLGRDGENGEGEGR